MIINEIIKEIWSNDRKQFEKMLEYTDYYSDDKLFEIAAQNKIILYKYPGTNMNLLPCPICTYRKNNEFAGCSMCDYECNDMLHKAILTTLRKRNKELYVKALKKSFFNVRGTHPEPEAFELISTYDVFSDEEFPEEMFIEIFSKEGLFEKKPFCYIFETRASSVSVEKLALLRKHLPPRSRVIIEFGVEVEDEWVRNHWLNKSITDIQISNSVKLIQSMGYKAAADILIGIPGFTEEQSIKHFRNTVLWLDNIGIDHIIALPLNRKIRTLQGAIYTYLRNNPLLYEKGIVQGEHTGVPWLTTIIRALYEAIDSSKDISKKLVLAELYSYQNSVDNVTAYNSRNCQCNLILKNLLVKYQKTHKEQLIAEAITYAMSNKHYCYKEYLSLLEKQSAVSVKEATHLIIYLLCSHFWPNHTEIIMNSFSGELDMMKD